MTLTVRSIPPGTERMRCERESSGYPCRTVHTGPCRHGNRRCLRRALYEVTGGTPAGPAAVGFRQYLCGPCMAEVRDANKG